MHQLVTIEQTFQKYPKTGLYYAVKVIGKDRIVHEGEKVHYLQIGGGRKWQWEDITDEAKDAFERDEREARAKAAEEGRAEEPVETEAQRRKKMSVANSLRWPWRKE